MLKEKAPQANPDPGVITRCRRRAILGGARNAEVVADGDLVAGDQGPVPLDRVGEVADQLVDRTCALGWPSALRLQPRSRPVAKLTAS